MKRISFVEEMREAIRADRKTMTRRLGKCPYKVGDVLGIGEPHRLYRDSDDFDNSGWVRCKYDDGTVSDKTFVGFSGQGVTVGTWHELHAGTKHFVVDRPARHRSGRFLPDPFIRDRIRITAIRREPLQAITPADARREGAPETSGQPEYHAFGEQSYVRWFAAIWDDLNGKRKGGARWADNPEVFVISFERVI